MFHWMRENRFVIAAVLAATWVLITAWLAPGVSLENTMQARPGFRAPGIQLTGFDGQTYRLGDLKGKVVLANFWASWCGPCRLELPTVERVYARYAGQGFVVLAINSTYQDTLKDASAFVQSNRLTFPILMDTSGETSRRFQVRSLPTSFLIDRSGIVREVFIGGQVSETGLAIRIEQLLKGKP